MKKLFFFPPFSEGHDLNPYTKNFKHALSPYFELVNPTKIYKGKIRLILLLSSFKADIYILNWIESIRAGFRNLPLFILSIFSLFILNFRRKKIIWIYHNIHPHFGENIYSKALQRYLFNHANLIITHSKDAYSYASKVAKCPVQYYCHPFSEFQFENRMQQKHYDVLLWGSILPYKGIAEFLENPKTKISKLKILVIGECQDPFLEIRIRKQTDKNITFENRRASYNELFDLIQCSRFILFPYIGACVSSSGALIDTISMGGITVGPNIGAFKDFAEEGIGYTYNNEYELYQLLNKKTDNFLDLKDYINNNTWEKFAYKLYLSIRQLYSIS